MEPEDITSLLAPLRSHVIVPDGAVDLFPRKIGPRILSLSDQNQILKAGPNVKLSEAKAMQYVARHTSVPVPEVYESYTKHGCGYIFMSKADGEPLARVWNDLGSEQRASVVSQLRDYAEQLRSLDGEFYGALWHQASEDIFFNHLPFRDEKIHYGPYYSRSQYNDGLVTALQNSRPMHSLNEVETDLEKNIRAVTDETRTFSHGDLHPLNILVDPKGIVTAIVDWGSSGFSVCGREYYEARKRSRNDEWGAALDEIFPEEARAHFDLFNEFDQALTQYTGF
jgi:serine/threonine protein kinase